MTALASTLLDSFVQTCKAAVAKVLTQMGAAGVTTPPAEPAGLKLARPEDAGLLAVRFSGGGCLKGQLQWSCAKTVALQCAQLLMAEPVNPSTEFTPAHMDGYLEFLRQVNGEIAVAWKEAQGTPTELVHQSEPGGAFDTQSSTAFALQSDKFKGLALRLDFDADMLAALSTAAEQPQETKLLAGQPCGAAQNLPSNLELLLDVELEATIRFGEREMLLQDVYALMPGAVVELNQLVNEPAELYVAGRPVATGEVVVVDGNFGLRVKEVLSPTQRVLGLPLG